MCSPKNPQWAVIFHYLIKKTNLAGMVVERKHGVGIYVFLNATSKPDDWESIIEKKTLDMGQCHVGWLSFNEIHLKVYIINECEFQIIKNTDDYHIVYIEKSGFFC